MGPAEHTRLVSSIYRMQVSPEYLATIARTRRVQKGATMAKPKSVKKITKADRSAWAKRAWVTIRKNRQKAKGKAPKPKAPVAPKPMPEAA